MTETIGKVLNGTLTATVEYDERYKQVIIRIGTKDGVSIHMPLSPEDAYQLTVHLEDAIKKTDHRP
jgi:hypothetical protein